MIVDVAENPNSGEAVMMRFKSMGPARRIRRVRLFQRRPEGEWLEITGWRDGPDPVCPAHAQPIEDSGAGVAILVTGGNWGLRLRPNSDPWNLDDAAQWGESYLVLADRSDTEE